MTQHSIPLGRIFGISIGLDYSWFVIFALLTWMLARSYPLNRRCHRGRRQGHQDHWQQRRSAGGHCRQTERERKCSWFCTQMAHPTRFERVTLAFGALLLPALALAAR